MPNHFLLTGNELVADWPEPLIFDERGQHKYDEWELRPRYTCSPELLAMLKEGERYEIGKHFVIDCLEHGGDVAVPVEKTASGYDDLDELLLSHGW